MKKQAVMGRVKSRRSVRRKSSMVRGLQSWYASLANTRLTPLLRAQDPFNNHAWVMAAAVTTAVVASQAPFTVFRETPDEINRRRAKARGGFRLRRGSMRTMVQRVIQRSAEHRFLKASLGLEPDYDHALSRLLAHPNPHQHGSQLFQMTELWLSVRGECFWVLEKDNGEPMLPGDVPDRIWPLSPDLFKPILSDGGFGELVGWEMSSAYYMPHRLKGIKVPLPLGDVVQFKYPNPDDPLRGLSRLGAVALGIEIDMLAKAHNRAVIENGGDPGGVLMYDEMMEEEEEKEFMSKWNSMYGGPENARRTALLSGGFKYASIALSPKDMQFLEQQKWDREEVLAVMGVPRSVLGVPDQNYATQLGQDANFWDKTLLPLMKLEETTLDATLFHNETDDVVGMHDVRDVEALRVGISEKTKTALDLTDQRLHMPPRVAYDIVGLSVPEYENDDVSIWTPADETVTDQPEQSAAAATMTTSLDTPEDRVVGAGDSLELIRHRLARAKARRWEEFAVVQETAEDDLSTRWRSWNSEEKRVVLAAFDEANKAKQIRALLKEGDGNLSAFLPTEQETSQRLRPKVRPFYDATLGKTYEFTIEELGVPVFAPDDALIVDVLEKREALFAGNTSASLRKRISAQVEAWAQTGDNISELRKRVASVFNVNASSAKTLSVARTEAGGYMNATRDAMFGAQGVLREAWSTAGDEHERDTHHTYGLAEPQDREFNYLSLGPNTGKGTLAFPGDSRCTELAEIMNCRCLKVPA